MTPSIRIVGRIKMISHDKGFGFIRREDAHDLFFHITECVKKEQFPKMEVNSLVLFSAGPGKRGEEGRDIELTPSPE